MNLVVVFICFLTSLGISEGISPATACTEGPNIVQLSCNSSEKIHVESITYYNGFNCRQALIDKTECGLPLNGTSSGLYPFCNGKITSCTETVFARTECQAARVDYRCIQDTEVYDMCGVLNKDFNNSFFLSSPHFPELTTFGTTAPCTCSIRGSTITSINILELELVNTGVRTRSNLLISYGDTIYNKTSFEASTIRKVVNDYLITDLTSFTVQLNPNMNPVSLWIEIHGISMVVTCSRDGTISLKTTPPSTTSAIEPTSTSPSTDTDKQSDLSTTNIILIVLSSLSLVVIVGMFLVILILCRRGKQTFHQNGDGREVTREGDRVGGTQDSRNVTTESDRNVTTESERNIYSELNHSASEPVRDEPYLELRVTNSTTEYNNAQNPNYLTVIANSTPDYQDIQNPTYITVM